MVSYSLNSFIVLLCPCNRFLAVCTFLGFAYYKESLHTDIVMTNTFIIFEISHCSLLIFRKTLLMVLMYQSVERKLPASVWDGFFNLMLETRNLKKIRSIEFGLD